MTVITLSGVNPVHIQNTYGQGFTLQNNGPGNLYLGNDTSVSPSTGWIVQPGVALPVTESVDLWGCTDSGKQCSIATLAGAASNQATVVEINGPVDVGTVDLAPGSTVGISGPVNVNGTVSANITNASLPITGNVGITSGTVDATITNATIDVAGNLNTSSRSSGVQINSYVYDTLTTAETNANIGAAAIDVSAYTSIIFSFKVGLGGTNPGSNGSPITDFIWLHLNQYMNTNVSAGYETLDPTWALQLTNGYDFSIQIPVVGKYLEYAAAVTHVAHTFTNEITMVVAGLSTVTGKPVYISNVADQEVYADSLPNVGAFSHLFLASASNQWISSRNGLATIQVLNTTGANTHTGFLSIAWIDRGTSRNFYGDALTGLPAGGTSIKQIYFPMAPMQIGCTLDTGGSFNITVSQDVS